MGSISRQLLFFSAMMIVSAALLVGWYWASASQQWLSGQQIQAIESTAIKGEAQVLAYINSISSNVRFLVSHKPVRGIVRATLAGGTDPVDGLTLAQWTRQLEQNFRTELEVHADQFQVRLIGLADGGRELVRVERVHGDIVVTEQAQLQQKQSRDYFRDIIQLAEGELYFSAINLNVEFGKVSLPYTPTLRVASPVFGENGALFGMVIVNADVGAMLQRYQQSLRSGGQQVYVVGDNRQFLVHPEPDKRYGSDLGTGVSLAAQFPALSGTIAQWLAQTGKQQAVTTLTVPGAFFLTLVKTPVGMPASHYLLGLIKTPVSQVAADVRKGLYPSLLITLLLTLAGLLPAWLLARLISRPIEQLTDAVNLVAVHGQAKALPVRRRDEIGRLSRAFVAMERMVREREARLADSADRIRATIDASVNAIITINQYGVIESVNPQTISMFGYDEGQLIGQNISMLMPEPHRERHDGYLRHYLQTGERRVIGIGRDLSAMRSDGSVFPIYLAVNPFTHAGAEMFTGTIMDLSDQKRLQDTLASSDEIKRIMESTHDLFISTDPEHRISYINRRAEQVLGVQEGAAAGLPLLELIPELSGPAGVPLLQALEEGREGYAELNLANPGGWFLTTCSAARASYHWQLVDVTALKQQQLSLEQQTIRLEQTNRELNDFAFVASHDLQEPLRKIQAFSDRLMAKYADALDERGRDYLQRMNAAAFRMSDLIQSLLQLSRVSSRAAAFETVRLNHVVEEVLLLFDERATQLQARITAGPLPAVEADAMQMARLIQNLLGNALKFHRPEHPPEISLYGGDMTENSVELIVEDNGIGIDASFSDKVFEPFERLHGRESYAGTGMGLAICRRIVERHDGTIRVEARKDGGEGCRFVITLPRQITDIGG